MTLPPPRSSQSLNRKSTLAKFLKTREDVDRPGVLEITQVFQTVNLIYEKLNKVETLVLYKSDI